MVCAAIGALNPIWAACVPSDYPNGLKLIPYCLWNNREPGNELQCWFRE